MDSRWVPLKEKKDHSMDLFETVIFAHFFILSLYTLTHRYTHMQVHKHTQTCYLQGLTTLCRINLNRKKKVYSFVESC